MIGARLRMSRRGLMYTIVAVQMVILAAIVGSQEINAALDSGAGVSLDVVRAYARKDPFRGAYIIGQSALELDGPSAVLPADRLKAGDEVLVFFAVEASGRRPITRVERRRRSVDPPFTPTSFSVPGVVRGADRERPSAAERARLVARAGDPRIEIELELPASIPVDDAALGQLTGTSLVRATLHRGFFGHRYLDDVRLVGRGWPPDVTFAYDAPRERLVILAPRYELPRAPSSIGEPPITDVFFFDGLGKETGSIQVAGRLVDGVVDPTDGALLALISNDQWGYGTVALARIREDGQVVRRSTPVAFDRVLGFDVANGAAWVLTGAPSTRPQAPYVVERLTLDGPRGPRLGPFASAPQMVVSLDQDAWVVETSHHRVTHLELTAGRVRHEYRDLNGPTAIAVDAGSLFVIEADRTQLSKLANDGRVLWRAPRFQELAWVVAEPGTGGGWVGASTFEGRPGDVFRFGSDGSVADPRARAGATGPIVPGRRRLAPLAVREPRLGRLYVLEASAIVILGPDGALLKRVDGFRLLTEQRIRR